VITTSTASLSRRLAALERDFSGGGGRGPGGEGESLSRKFISSFIHAIGHIRRAPLDSQSPWGYRLEKLRNGSPFSVAVYIAALRTLGHEDEAEAHRILDGMVEARGVDPAPLEKLIDVADRLK
jgi:hypothetical protein